jgi:16S rRNA (cytosine967-C5)-methyltransferase
MPVSPARAAAFDTLLHVERESSYAAELLHSAVYDKLSVPDHALATEIVMGVLRWRSRLDDEIAQASSQPLSKLDPEILVALRIGFYQLRWLDRIPARAAIHEGVELAKRARKRSAAPFVNAVLRKLAARGRRTQPTLPTDESARSPESLARFYSHPLWLVERWANEYRIAVTRRICEHNQSIPRTAIRMRDPGVEGNLQAERIELAPGALLTSARIVREGNVTHTAAYRASRIAIQDEASQLVAALLGLTSPKENTRILDCCAAPGGKTLAVADRNSAAEIIAIELHPHRARLLQKLVCSSQADSTRRPPIHVVVADACRLPLRGNFARVLADVPCSGTGTLARNPEIKWRLKPDDLANLSARQCAILRSALEQVAPGGRLIYSTCSLEREENENVVEKVLKENNSFRLLDCSAELDRLKAEGELAWPDPASLTRGPYLHTLPGVHPCDGFFAAILEKV